MNGKELWCDLETIEDKWHFIESGMATKTGIISEGFSKEILTFTEDLLLFFLENMKDFIQEKYKGFDSDEEDNALIVSEFLSIFTIERIKG